MSEVKKLKYQKESMLEKYIKRAQEEVATWPEWKRKHISIGFSEYQRKQEEKREKQSKNNIK